MRLARTLAALHRLPGRISVSCLIAASIAGCAGTVSDHENIGDRAYLARDYTGALIEYRLALVQRGSNAQLRAKAAVAALRSGDLQAAVEEFVGLASEGEERDVEAADGLERVARAAIEADDQQALGSALEALVAVAQDRALAGFAREIAAGLGESLRSEQALTVLPRAAAAAPDTRLLDSLVYVYARALMRTGNCELAVSAFESLLRRNREPSVREGASTAIPRCALRLGQRALDQGKPSVAEDWFERAVARRGDDEYTRAAYIGLGDVRFSRGDYLGAAEAYQRAIRGAAASDALRLKAIERLNDIARAGTDIPR